MISVNLNSHQNLALPVFIYFFIFPVFFKKPLVISMGVYWHLSEVFVCLPLIIMRLNTFCLLAFFFFNFQDHFTIGWGLRPLGYHPIKPDECLQVLNISISLESPLMHFPQPILPPWSNHWLMLPQLGFLCCRMSYRGDHLVHTNI